MIKGVGIQVVELGDKGSRYIQVVELGDKGSRYPGGRAR